MIIAIAIILFAMLMALSVLFLAVHGLLATNKAQNNLNMAYFDMLTELAKAQGLLPHDYTPEENNETSPNSLQTH